MSSTYELLIDGTWQKGSTGGTFPVHNPATGELVADVAQADEEDVNRAAEAAHRAFEEWSRLPSPKRAGLMQAAAALVRERQSDLARTLTEEQGKPLGEAKGEIGAAAEALEYYAEEAHRMLGEVIPTGKASRKSLVIRQPVGPVAAIAPWNYPVSLLAWKVAPALIAGCTLVCKPASLTPLAVTKFVGCLVDAGLPAGVINLVLGPGSTVGTALVEHALIRKVAFTGETATGKDIMRRAAGTLKRLSLELGGNCPLVVLADADVQTAAKRGAYRAFRNMGQVCNSINRMYVDQHVYDEFVERLVAEARKLTIGNGLDQGVDLGPMVSAGQREHVMAHVEDARNQGAEIRCGGKVPDGAQYVDGFFYEPTVLTGVTHQMRIMTEETFGPVAPVMAVSGMEEAVRRANESPYGLVSYAYTRDLANSWYLAEHLASGTVGINNVSGGETAYPYGGWKESGMGLELSHHGVEEYLHVKHIRVDLG